MLSEPWAGEFTLDIKLSGEVKIAPILKPMLDGLIASLQAHDGSNEGQLRSVFAAFGDADELWRQVTADDHAVLGVWKMLLPRGGGAMWSPGDDRCSAFRVVKLADAANEMSVVVRAAPDRAVALPTEVSAKLWRACRLA